MSGPPTLPGVRHRQVHLRTGVHMHVAEAGPARAPVVVAVHGWPQHWWMWRGVIGPLAKRFRVLAVDLRGHGWSSPAPDGDYRKERLADDLLALLDVEGVERVRYLGHDWGGYAGLLLARRAPERIERLLACSIAPPWVSPVRVLPHAWRFAYTAVVGAPVLGAALVRQGRAIRAILEPAMPAADVDVFVERITEPERAAASSALYRQFLLREAPAGAAARSAAALPMPVKLLSGAGDPVIRPSLLEGLPYEVEIVPDAGHFLVDERPELVADRAGAFFS